MNLTINTKAFPGADPGMYHNLGVDAHNDYMEQE